MQGQRSVFQALRQEAKVAAPAVMHPQALPLLQRLPQPKTTSEDSRLLLVCFLAVPDRKSHLRFLTLG